MHLFQPRGVLSYNSINMGVTHYQVCTKGWGLILEPVTFSHSYCIECLMITSPDSLETVVITDMTSSVEGYANTTMPRKTTRAAQTHIIENNLTHDYTFSSRSRQLIAVPFISTLCKQFGACSTANNTRPTHPAKKLALSENPFHTSQCISIHAHVYV